MKTQLALVLLLAGLGRAASLQPEFTSGRALYLDGEFRKAAAQFEAALAINPDDAECHYWTGMAYQRQADIAAPLDHKNRVRARAHLTRAVELAPDRTEYRRELFEFLLDSGGFRQAAALLRSVPPSDPDYEEMLRRFAQDKRAAGAVDARLGRLFLAAPRAAYRFAEPLAAVARPNPM
jgi:tetratricopeptide (TPR) repeat protein